MKRSLVRGWDFTLPVSGATSTLAVGATRYPLVPRAPANQQPDNVVGVSTPFGAVSTQVISVFVPRLLELVVIIWKDF